MNTILLRALMVGALFAVSIPITGATAGENSSPQARRCMAQAGITYAGWRSGHAGTQAQVDKYIACRDRANATAK